MQSTGKHEKRAKTVGSFAISGFSVVELLIVVAILLILAAIIIPNFFEACVRSHPMKAFSEMRNLAVSLETYYIDHNAYPPAADDSGKIVPYTEDGSNVSAGYVPFLLSTPISYTESLPVDPFNRGKDGIRKTYRYATDGSTCWIMSSYGPDKDQDIDLEEFPSKKGAAGDITKFLSNYGSGKAVLYDSSNGTTSSGDMIKTGVREESNPPQSPQDSK